MKFSKYQKNLKKEGDYIISYATKVAIIEGDKLRKLPWKVDGKTSSPTTSRHINFAAQELNLVVI